MPKTKKAKKSNNFRCPQCGGAEFKHPVSALDVHIVRRGKLQYQRTILSDESQGEFRCAKCGAEMPDELLETVQPHYQAVVQFNAA